MPQGLDDFTRLNLPKARRHVIYAQNSSDDPLSVKNTSGSEVFAVSPTGTVSNPTENLALNTEVDSKTVRINSRNYAQTSGSSIGFQSKPAQNAASSGSVIGGEISPRVNSGIALSGSGSIIGLHVDTYLKGTAAGTIGGDVRGLQIELVTDDAGTRDITGNVSAIRVRMAFSAGTVTGNKTVLRVEKPETQTNSETYDALFELTDTVAGVWNDAPGTEPTTADGYIKVIVNGADRYIQLYSGAPVD